MRVDAMFYLLVLCEQDATELVAKLRAYHNTSQLQEDKVRSMCFDSFALFFLVFYTLLFPSVPR